VGIWSHLKHRVKAGLHYGDYRSKQVPFEAQKNIFYIQKGPSLERFTPCRKELKTTLARAFV
jgi:hypothetical protein